MILTEQKKYINRVTTYKVNYDSWRPTRDCVPKSGM